MAEVNLLISPDFADLYVSFFASLLEANPKGLIEIYEFSAQYFENKLKDRPGNSKKSGEQKTLFQRDVPNSPGKKQFLPDFSYDSVLILHPEVCSPVPLFEKNLENVLNEERKVMWRLNDSNDQHKSHEILSRKPQELQDNERINQLTEQDLGEYEHKIGIFEDQEMLKKGREEKYNESRYKDFKAEKEQNTLLNVENLLMSESQNEPKDHDEYRKNDFETLKENMNAFNKVNDTKMDEGQFQECFCLAHRESSANSRKSMKVDEDLFQKCFCHPESSAVSQDEKKKKVYHRKEQIDQFENQNESENENKNKVKLQKIRTPGGSKTFIDAQFSSGNQVLNEIVEFSKLLPECLEIMGQMFNDLDGRNQRSKEGKNNSHFTSDDRGIHDCVPVTLDESCEAEANQQEICNNKFRSTSSQTDFVRSFELMNTNSSVLMPAMFMYVFDVVNAAKRLLYALTVKDNDDLPIEKIAEGISVPNGSNIEFNKFEQILEFCKESLNNPKNSLVRTDQNGIHESLEQDHPYNPRNFKENENAWKHESNEESENCQVHRKYNPSPDVAKLLHYLCKHQTAQNTEACVDSAIQNEIFQESENCSDMHDVSLRSSKQKEQNISDSNESCSYKESSNNNPNQNKKLFKDINDTELEYSKEDISKSFSDSMIISSRSNQDTEKNYLVNNFLLKLKKACQTSEDEDSFFRSVPGLIRTSAHEPSEKDIKSRYKSTGYLSHDQNLHPKQISVRSKPKMLPDGKDVHKDKKSFCLLHPRRSVIRREKEKVKNLLNYYKMYDSKDKQKKHEHINKRSSSERSESSVDTVESSLETDECSSETDENIKETAQQNISDSKQAGPKDGDSGTFFISAPVLREFIQNLPVSVDETSKSTGDLSQEQSLQEKGPRKRFREESPPKDKLEDIQVGGLSSHLGAKTSLTDTKGNPFHMPNKVGTGSMTVGAKLDDEDSGTKLVVHEIHQATSKLRMKILKTRHFYKETMFKTGIDGSKKDLDDKWLNIGVPVTGRNWLRSYFTARMIRRYQKQLETDKIDHKIEDLATPVLKHQECSYGLGSYFSQRSLFGCVRLWYFSKKLREYQKLSNY